MKPTFAPLTRVGKEVLTEASGIDFTGTDMRGWFCCTVLDHDIVAAVIACEPQNEFDWRCNVAVADPRAITRKLLRVIFSTLFSRAARITALVEPSNEQALRQMERLGFVYEGFLRRGFDGRRDAMIYGMLPEDCPWMYANPRLRRQVSPRAEMH